MALIPVRPLYSASATATNGSDIIQVTGNVDCSFMSSGSIVSLGTRQLTDAISGTAPDLSGNSTIKLRRPWSDPTTTAPLLAFMSREGLADAVARLRQIIDAQEGTLQGAFSYMGAWDASSGNFPPAPGEGLGSQMYRVSVAGTMGGRAYRVGEPLYYDQFTSQWRSFFELATAFSTNLLLQANAADWRTALGLGSAATLSANTILRTTGDQFLNGRLAIGSSASYQGKLTLTEDTDANNYFWGRHNFNGANSYTGYVLNAFGNSWAIRMGSFAANANALEIVQDVGGSDLRRVVINTDGSLLLSAANQFASNYRMYVQATNPGAGMIAYKNFNETTCIPAVFLNSAGSVVGSIQTSQNSTAYNTSSDYRLKEDWVPVSDACQKVLQLNPVNFAWKLTGQRVDGFLAHELAEVVPEAVTGEKDAVEYVEVEVEPAQYRDQIIPAELDEDGNVLVEERIQPVLVKPAVVETQEKPVYQGIDQAKLVPLLTAALQETLRKINDLEARVKALE